MKKTYQQEMFQKAFQIWEQNASSYQTMIENYYRLLEEKKKRKITPTGALSRATINKFPKIDFLEIETPEQAKKYLESLSSVALERLICRVNDILEYDYSYNTIKSFVCEACHQIKLHDKKRERRKILSKANDYWIICWKQH